MTLCHREKDMNLLRECERSIMEKKKKKGKIDHLSKMLYSRLFSSSASHKRAQPFFFFLRANECVGANKRKFIHNHIQIIKIPTYSSFLMK